MNYLGGIFHSRVIHEICQRQEELKCGYLFKNVFLHRLKMHTLKSGSDSHDSAASCNQLYARR